MTAAELTPLIKMVASAPTMAMVVLMWGFSRTELRSAGTARRSALIHIRLLAAAESALPHAMHATAELTALSPFRPVRLDNRNCPYCGRLFSDGIVRDKEHVIGRRFVPRGAIGDSWNVLLSACRACNGTKAGLEDDISAITMLPDPAGRFASDDPRLRRDAERKAKGSISRRTGRLVADSNETLRFSRALGLGTVTASFVAPPQLDEGRAFQLAQWQLQAFFFFLTFNQQTTRGGFWMGGFYPLAIAHRGDWGNPRLRWFQEATAGWDARLCAVAADGFFKCWIRRRDDDTHLWAWAIEWNKNYRIVGYFGEREPLTPISATIPSLGMESIHEWEDGYLRIRTERPLPAHDDHLFDWPEQVKVAEVS